MATLFAASELDVPAAPVPSPNPLGGSPRSSVEKKLVRAAEYRRLAIAAGALAEASPLAHVREKHEEAAARWTALALLDERPPQPAPTQSRSLRQAPA